MQERRLFEVGGYTSEVCALPMHILRLMDIQQDTSTTHLAKVYSSDKLFMHTTITRFDRLPQHLGKASLGHASSGLVPSAASARDSHALRKMQMSPSV